MISNKIKKMREINNKTRKRKDKTSTSLYLTPEQQAIVCKKSANTYNTFEDKIEELFKKNNIDVVSTSFNLEKQIVSELKKAVNPKGIKPNEDFYSYINDRWIIDYELKKQHQYIIQVDDFRIVQDKVYRELIEIIKDFISNPKTKDSKKAICIKKAYDSFKIYNTDEQTKCLSKIIVEFVDEINKNKDNVWKRIGIINKNEIISSGCPFVWSINPDDKNPNVYRCYLEPPQLSIIDVDVYFDDNSDNEETKKYKNNYRKQFFTYLNNLFTISFGENHGFNVKDIFDTEFEILNAMACDLIKETDEDDYNLISKDEALEIFGFNWTEFCKSLGFKKIPENFVTSNVNYLLCGTKLLLERWNSEQWRTFWIYLYIRQQSRWNKEGAENFFKFEGNFVRGQAGKVDDSIRPIFPMGFLFNTFLTNEYISKYNNPQAINYVKTMAEDLKTVFIRIIKRNHWMQPKTKAKALEKLKNFKLTVGSPEILRGKILYLTIKKMIRGVI